MTKKSSVGVERPAAASVCCWPAQSWTGRLLSESSEATVIIALSGLALAIRAYLVATNYCISSDGVEYVQMARRFAGGDWVQGLSSVFSPLYPMLIALAHRVVPNWELAGGLVSLAFGVATIPAIYFLMREVHGGRDLAAGAAALAAIHPDLAAYSASVLTEAGFIFLVVLVVHLAVRGVSARSPGSIFAAGLASGAAYLYRTEGIGLPLVIVGFLALGPLVWGGWGLSFAARAVICCLAGFVLIASPYLIYLRLASGHWMIGRELGAAITYKIGEASSDGGYWRALAFSRYVPLLATLRQELGLYLKKAALDFAQSFYYFAQAMEPLFALALLIGLYRRGRAVVREWREALLAAIVCFYFCGLALLYTGRRFLAHYVALSFGWVVLGVAAAAIWLSRVALPGNRRLPAGALLVGLAVATLPRTLWPLGYDMRGYREAGTEIARTSGATRAVVSTDSRVAFYAGAPHLDLPLSPKPDLCRWLEAHPKAGYVMLTSREEEGAADFARAPCLVFLHRYPRYGRGYYDLFRVAGWLRQP
jgi:hypothetical protein